jgi:hypothetical protein
VGTALHTVFKLKNPKKKDQLEDLGVVGRTILKWIFRKQFGGVDLIRVVQRRDKGRNAGFNQHCSSLYSSHP